MRSLIVSSLVFALVFSGAMAGMFLRRVLPQQHLSTDAKETVRLAIGLVVTMTGLVLGMLVSSAKTYYDGQRNQVATMSAEIIILNETLKSYGPETLHTRIVARHFVEEASNRIWPKEKTHFSQLRPEDSDSNVNAQLDLLVPQTPAQASAKTQTALMISKLKESYWLLYLQSEQNSISVPLLVVITLWLITIFTSFGLFAPRNLTVIATLVSCALAASLCIFVIMEMYSPFSGTMRISSAAVRDAVAQMSKDE